MAKDSEVEATDGLGIEYVFKILIIGDSGVGKSSFLSRFVDDSFASKALQTVGVDFRTRILTIQNHKVRLQLWDTAGQERFRTITGTFYRGAMGVILVYDITQFPTYTNLAHWVKNVREKCSAEDNPTLMMVGNKLDQKLNRDVSSEQGRQLADIYDAKFLEASAQSGENVEEAFHLLTESILKKQSLLSSMTNAAALSTSFRLTKRSPLDLPETRESRCC